MIVAIVQARLGSHRLPRKTLALIQGKPMIGWVLERLRCAKTLDQIVVATSTAATDDDLAGWLKRKGAPYFRGNESDVLDRYYQAARSVHAETIVRITADCPLIMPDVVDRVVRGFQERQADYVSNTQPPTYPDGFDTEVFSFFALERAWKEARSSVEREHVTPYFYQSGFFVTRNVPAEDAEDWSRVKWSVDYPEDLRLVRRIYRKLGNRAMTFDWRTICRMCLQEAEIKRLKSGRKKKIPTPGS